MVRFTQFDIASRSDCPLGLLAPASIEPSQVVNGIRRLLLRCDCTGRSDGEPDLFEIVRTGCHASLCIGLGVVDRSTTGFDSGGFGGRSVDGRPGHRTRRETMDELKHLAKVRVAGFESRLQLSMKIWETGSGSKRIQQSLSEAADDHLTTLPAT